jgi:hypothetical protein
LQGAAASVFFCEKRLAHRPRYRHGGIIPQEGSLELRMIDGGALVNDFGFIGMRAKSVRKTWRKIHHPLIRRAQERAEPTAKRRRTTPHIDRHIEDFAAHGADQLPLGMLKLVVQPAEHILTRERVVILHECLPETGGGKFIRMIRLEKESPLIAEHTRFHEHDPYTLKPRKGRSADDLNFRRRFRSVRPNSDLIEWNGELLRQIVFPVQDGTRA